MINDSFSQFLMFFNNGFWFYSMMGGWSTWQWIVSDSSQFFWSSDTLETPGSVSAVFADNQSENEIWNRLKQFLPVCTFDGFLKARKCENFCWFFGMRRQNFLLSRFTDLYESTIILPFQPFLMIFFCFLGYKVVFFNWDHNKQKMLSKLIISP